jgi:hypothetical protein
MTDTNSWWARKLGRAPAEAPSSPNSYAPTGYAPTNYGAPAQAPPQQWQPPPEPTGPPATWIEDPSVPGGKRLNWREWRGGRANIEEKETCPNCGSTNFFSLRSESKVTAAGRVAPAPQCFECSYNGIFTNFGGT